MAASFATHAALLSGARAMPELGYEEAACAQVHQTLMGPRENVSADMDEWRGMSGRAIDLIREQFREDFDAFGYDPADI